ARPAPARAPAGRTGRRRPPSPRPSRTESAGARKRQRKKRGKETRKTRETLHRVAPARALGADQGEKWSAGGHGDEDDALPVVGSAHRNDSHQCPHLLIPLVPP